MTRGVIMLGIGALLLGIGGTVVAFMLAALVRGGASSTGSELIVPTASIAIGLVLIIVSLRGMMRSRERRAMPLAPARAAPAPAGAGGSRWEVVDVASEVARRLEGSPCSVHVAGARIEIRWAGESAAQERCELRDAGEGELSHTDVIESAFEVQRRHRGSVFRADPSGRRLLDASASGDFDTLDRRAVHRAVDDALAIAGWRREG